MKKLSFLVLAVAGMLFAACSSDKDAAEGPQVPGEIIPDGYMALNIKLPTQPLMRAVNDNLMMVLLMSTRLATVLCCSSKEQMRLLQN